MLLYKEDFTKDKRLCRDWDYLRTLRTNQSPAAAVNGRPWSSGPLFQQANILSTLSVSRRSPTRDDAINLVIHTLVHSANIAV